MFSRVQILNAFLKCNSYISFALDPTLFKQIFTQFSNLKLILMFLLIAFTVFYFIPQIALTSTYQFQVIRIQWLIFLSVPCTSHYCYNYYRHHRYTAAVSKLYYMVSCPRVTIQLCPKGPSCNNTTKITMEVKLSATSVSSSRCESFSE
jgi:hypothetical protein